MSSTLRRQQICPSGSKERTEATQQVDDLLAMIASRVANVLQSTKPVETATIIQDVKDWVQRVCAEVASGTTDQPAWRYARTSNYGTMRNVRSKQVDKTSKFLVDYVMGGLANKVEILTGRTKLFDDEDETIA